MDDFFRFLAKNLPLTNDGDSFFFFFLISNGKYILKKNTAPYIGNVLDRQKHQETKLQ